MEIRALPFAVALAASLLSSEFSVLSPLSSPAEAAAPQRRTPRAAKSAKKAAEPPPLPCGDLVSFAVLLDRQGFSPGQIDDSASPNFMRALGAMRAARNIVATGAPDCDSWHSLGGDDGADPTIVDYTITDADVAGPFAPQIPRDLVAQAELPALAYRSPLEALSERFHAAPALLQKLNPGIAFTAGSAIKVPGVQPFDSAVKPPPNDEKPDGITIEVSREESALRATNADGSLTLFAPVTTGSEHDPLPIGEWKVDGVQWNPPFHYNPTLFWDAKANDTKALIKPGPNNPVGVVWIDLNKDHYGLHGTPEPGSIGTTQSHGCVRLTNWDAARVAGLVKPGTLVKFR
jgi:lipoprotein-anchoring transpeptidase ErfK/SrfK